MAAASSHPARRSGEYRVTPGSLRAMPPPRRLPSAREIPWGELRRRAAIVYLWLQAGWNELSAAERSEVRKLLTKSRGRPRNLSRDEAKRLGQLAGRAASAAARRRRR
jgi:hypothetical protein